MDQFLQATVLGLVTASIFAVAATGLVLTYTTTGIFNFAHGALGMLGAYTYWQLRYDWGWPAPLALLVVLGVMAPLVGAAIEVGIMRGLANAPETIRVVVTISLLVALLGVGWWLWPRQESRPFPPFWGRSAANSVTWFDVRISYHQITAILVAVALAFGLRLVLYGSRAGVAMRAAVDDRSLAMLNGARPHRSAMLAWGIGVACAALAGILIAPLTGLNHLSLTLLVVNAYAAAMIGRLRNLPMTFVGAMILGLADAWTITYLHSDSRVVQALQRRVDDWGFVQANVPDIVDGFRFALPAILLFVVLLALRTPRPRGHGLERSREHMPAPSLGGSLLTAAAFVGVGVYLAKVMLDYQDSLAAAKIAALAIVGLSLVPLVGFAGQLSLCQMSFAGIGAVVMAHHGQGGDPVALLWAALVAGAVGALVALPAIRLGGLYLALATGAFAMVLDRWIFQLSEFELGPWTIKFFPSSSAQVDPIDLPGTEKSDGLLIAMSVIFAFFFLLVVMVRRSTFGHRLLAMKQSPAAAATIGMNLTRLKLAVFALSAAMAGVGGALYAGSLGSAAPAGDRAGIVTSGVVRPDTFEFITSLPLLLLAVVGGIGSAAGALVAAIMLGGMPILVDMWPWFDRWSDLLPGLVGVSLGRNPNGVVQDLREAFEPVRRRPALVIVELVAIAAVLGLRWAELVSGGGFAILLLSAALLGPVINALRSTRAEPALAGESGSAVEIPTEDVSWEYVGVDRPFAAGDVDKLDRALGVGS
jgi:branched-chain amino acid transport system permease protein